MRLVDTDKHSDLICPVTALWCNVVYYAKQVQTSHIYAEHTHTLTKINRYKTADNTCINYTDYSHKTEKIGTHPSTPILVRKQIFSNTPHTTIS